jgi:hypothetical protein
MKPLAPAVMGHAITVRLSKELAAWLEEVVTRTGVSQGKIVRDQLDRARAAAAHKSFIRLAGSVRGPRPFGGCGAALLRRQVVA